MANIKVNDIKSASADIKPAGAELFGDSESFISDLEDNELQWGGAAMPWSNYQCATKVGFTCKPKPKGRI